MNKLISQARDFAIARHAYQTRKYTGEPYHVHLSGVADLVASVPHTPQMIAAAWLHDTVEDTGTTGEEILQLFGSLIASYVAALTDPLTPADGNRAFRKACYRNRIADAAPECKTIKLADLIDNTGSIVKHDPKFAKVYLREKAELLEVLRDGDRTLWDRAHDILKQSGLV